MFLILSREVLLVSGDYRKRSHTSRLVQRFVHARILARCLQKICRQIVLPTDSVVFCYLYFFS